MLNKIVRRPSRRGVSRNVLDFIGGEPLLESPLPQGRE